MNAMPVRRLYDAAPMPVLGFGTWRFGGALTADHSGDAREIMAIERAYQAGFRHFDTAEMYGGGHTEELLGTALRGVPREELFLTGKVWKTHWRADDVLRACENSLRRLGVDVLDLYLIHQVDPAMDMAETLAAMNLLAERGLIRHLGVSNFSLERLRRAAEFSERPIAVNQIHYNLAVRDAEDSGLLAYCRAQGILVTAYRPLKGIDLEVACLRAVAAECGCAPAECALAWLLSQENVTALAATHDPAHLAENFRAAQWRMSPERVEQLRMEFPACQRLPASVELS